MAEKRKWELIRCIYDSMGMATNEIEDPKRFAKALKDGKQVSWCIATILDGVNKTKIARIELEGSKENLEFVLNVFRG